MPTLLARLIIAFTWFLVTSATFAVETMTVVESRMIWAEAPHNAFTDLHRQHERWYCAFREGAAHVSPDGAVRVLTSEDGKAWQSVARLTAPWADLRDPKLTMTPDGKLLVTAGALLHEAKDGTTNQSVAWTSKEGTEWDGPHEIGEPNIWMWSCERYGDMLYSYGYFKEWPSKKYRGSNKGFSTQTPGKHMIRLYRSGDGLEWTPVTSQSYNGHYINETAIMFQKDGRMIALTRRENGPQPRVARIGVSASPYADWTWRDGDHRLNGRPSAPCPLGELWQRAGGR